MDVPSPPEPAADDRTGGDDFHQIVHSAPPSLPAEFWAFLKENKKWWLVPILLALLLLGLLAVLSSSGLGPFIYPFA